SAPPTRARRSRSRSAATTGRARPPASPGRCRAVRPPGGGARRADVEQRLRGFELPMRSSVRAARPQRRGAGDDRSLRRAPPARAFYTTRDSVEDFEALRKALGVDKVTLYGVSYGTKVAVAYAMAHPEHVESLVLDSVVDPTYSDPFDLEGLAALPRALTEVC